METAENKSFHLYQVGTFVDYSRLIRDLYLFLPLKTGGSLMQVESIAECSLGAFCNTFDLH